MTNQESLDFVAQRISTVFRLPFESKDTPSYISETGTVMSLEELKAQLKNKHLLSAQQLHDDIAEALNSENFEGFRTPLNEEAFKNSILANGKRLCDSIIKALEDEVFEKITKGSINNSPKMSIVFNNQLVESSLDRMINNLHPIETSFGVSLQTVWESIEDHLSDKLKVFTQTFLVDISHALLFIGQPAAFCEAELISIYQTLIQTNDPTKHQNRINLLLLLISKTQTHEESRSLFAFLIKLSDHQKSNKQKNFIFENLQSILQLNFHQNLTEGSRLIRFLLPKFATQVTIGSSTRMVINKLLISEQSDIVTYKIKVALSLILNESETLAQKNYHFLIENLPLIVELKKEDFELVEFALMFLINDLIESDTVGVAMINTAFIAALAIPTQHKSRLCESFNEVLDKMIIHTNHLNNEVYLYAKVVNAILSNFNGYKQFSLQFTLPDSESLSFKSLGVEVFKMDKLSKLLKDVSLTKGQTKGSQVSSFENVLNSFRDQEFQSADFNLGTIEVLKTERKVSISLPKHTSCLVDFQQLALIDYLTVVKDDSKLMGLNEFSEKRPAEEDLSVSSFDAFDAVLADVYVPKEESY